MDVYGSLGAVETTLVTSESGVQKLTKAASAALLQFLSNQYPQLTSSWTASTGASAPSFDPNADLWSYFSVATPAQPGEQTALAQIQSLAPGAVVLVDLKSAEGVIKGQMQQLVYAIGKNSTVASLANPSGSLALLDLTAMPGVVTDETKPEKKFSIVLPLVGAGVGLLVGGPVGAVVGAGLGLGVEAVRTAA